MRKRAMAIGCHPDDIEFMMAGTMMLLREAGYELHYMNLASGSCGTDKLDRDAIVETRTRESREAARFIGAVYHEPLVDDLAVFYTPELTHRLGAIIRNVHPDIILTHGPDEYMEDHSNTCRLVVTAAFCRGMKNFPTRPKASPVSGNICVYHALPYGLHDQLRIRVWPEMYVNVGGMLDSKREMLAMHKSQKEWLDVSQGLDAYLRTMEEMTREVGGMSERFELAEGWRRHLHLGLCGPHDNPLKDALRDKVAGEPRYGRLRR